MKKNTQAANVLQENKVKNNGDNASVKKFLSLEEVQSIRAYYENIIRCLPNNVYWLDRNCITKGCNENVLRLIGLKSFDEFVGITYEEMGRLAGWTEGQAQSFKKDDIAVMETGIPKINVEEPPLCDADGNLIYYLSTRVPLFNENKEVIGVVGISVDITDRKKAEAEVCLAKEAAEKAKERAEQANQAKGQFLSIMSHEIRGPIANVISAVDFLKPGTHASPEIQAQMIENIDQQARNALNILKNTMHYLALDSKDFQQRMSDFYLPGFLAKLERQYADQVAPGVVFRCKLLHPIDHVTFDFMHSLEVLRIIIDNAVKFTTQGSITLSVSLLAPQSIRFTLTDTGSGIEENYLKTIFKTFLNPELLKTEKLYVKTGLKLPLARRISELSGGHLQIESAAGKGTTVYFDMPYIAMNLFESKAAPPLEESVDEAADMLTHTTEEFFPFNILLVEDDATTAFLETEALKRLGCQVTHAETAFKAIEILNSQTFDLIFVDITLPDMTGVSLTEAIRPMLPETTELVALTSHSSDHDHDYFLRHGMMTMLGKPVTYEDFKRFFQGYLRVLDSEDE